MNRQTTDTFAEVTDADLKGIVDAFSTVVERLQAADLNCKRAKRSLRVAKKEQARRFILGARAFSRSLRRACVGPSPATPWPSTR